MAQRLAQPQQALLGEAAGGCSRRTVGLCEQLTVARHLDACKKCVTASVTIMRSELSSRPGVSARHAEAPPTNCLLWVTAV